MNTAKLREALADLEQQRNVIDDGIKVLRKVIAAMESPEKAPEIQRFPRLGRMSYIDDAVYVLEGTSRPMHINELTEAIRSLREGKRVSRASVESSLVRHISTFGDKSKIIKMGPSKYGLPAWRNLLELPEQINAL